MAGFVLFPRSVVLFFSLSAAIPAVAVAPNARDAAKPPDARLEQRVTFEAAGEPLDALLPRLSKQTGVSFTFEGTNVGDRKAIILVRDLPLKELKEALAATFFGFRWQAPTRKTKTREYVLVQDLRARQIEAELQSFQERQRARRLRQLLDGARNNGRDLDPEGQKLVRDPGTRSALEAIARLTPGQTSKLRTMDWLEFSLGDLFFTAAQEQHWSKQVGMKLEAMRRRESGYPDTISVEDLKDAPPSPIRELPKLEFSLRVYEQEDGACDLLFSLRSSLMQHKFPAEVLADATIPLTRATDDPAAGIKDVQEFLGVPAAKDTPDIPVQGPELDRKIAPLTPEQARALAQPALVQSFGPYWARWLLPLAKRTGIAIVSDDFLMQPRAIPKEVTGLTLREAFDEADRVYQRRWVKKGPIYSLRHRRWYLMTKVEPPARVVEPLKTTFKHKGRLDLEDLALGGELNMEQVLRATSYLDLPYFWIFRDHNTTLRFLHALTPIQRRLAEANGVTLGTLSDATAREWFRAAAWDVAPKLDDAEMSRVVFTIRSEVDAKNTLTLSFHWRRPEREVGMEQAQLVVGYKGR